MKRCTVAYALPQRQWLWEVEAPDSATVDEIISALHESLVTA